MKHSAEWAQIFRDILTEDSELNGDEYDDEEILQITKGLVAPAVCQELGIYTDWMYDLYWMSWMTMEPTSSIMSDMVNINLFKNRAKKNKN